MHLTCWGFYLWHTHCKITLWKHIFLRIVDKLLHLIFGPLKIVQFLNYLDAVLHRYRDELTLPRENEGQSLIFSCFALRVE